MSGSPHGVLAGVQALRVSVFWLASGFELREAGFVCPNAGEIPRVNTIATTSNARQRSLMAAPRRHYRTPPPDAEPGSSSTRTGRPPPQPTNHKAHKGHEAMAKSLCVLCELCGSASPSLQTPSGLERFPQAGLQDVPVAA